MSSSSSSEYSVFSGNQPTKSPEKSSTFSQTCSLLSQYIKEKGNFGDLNLGITTRTAIETPPKNLTTLNLLSPNSPPQSEIKTAPLTIFYDGRLVVFDDFPAEKVEEIMKLAKKETPRSSYGYSRNQNQASIVGDLPIARKASLHRFMEKRKDRISAKAPYQTKNHSSAHVKPAESIPWLTLGVEPRQI